MGKGDEAEVEDLLRRGANPNACDAVGISVLNEAVEQGHSAIVERLIRAGADVNHRTPDGWTPLHHAVDAEADAFLQVGKPRDLAVIRLLLQAGADPHAKWERAGRPSETPLDMARQYGWREAVEAMTQGAQ